MIGFVDLKIDEIEKECYTVPNTLEEQKIFKKWVGIGT